MIYWKENGHANRNAKQETTKKMKTIQMNVKLVALAACCVVLQVAGANKFQYLK